MEGCVCTGKFGHASAHGAPLRVGVSARESSNTQANRSHDAASESLDTDKRKPKEKRVKLARKSTPRVRCCACDLGDSGTCGMSYNRPNFDLRVKKNRRKIDPKRQKIDEKSVSAAFGRFGSCRVAPRSRRNALGTASGRQVEPSWPPSWPSWLPCWPSWTPS